jgi:hypothetical protein
MMLCKQFFMRLLMLCVDQRKVTARSGWQQLRRLVIATINTPVKRLLLPMHHIKAYALMAMSTLDIENLQGYIAASTAAMATTAGT